MITPVQFKRTLLTGFALFLLTFFLVAQNNVLKLKYSNSTVYAGIEVGSKGVKMSLVEIGKNLSKNGNFNILKDTSVNTDFISFTQPTFQATLDGLFQLYTVASQVYSIQPDRIFTVVSSGVKTMAEKGDKMNWVTNLADSFKLRIKDPNRKLAVVDVAEEARLSHLGIVPESRRYTTFLIDIGSGNTKGGYFPNGNSKNIKLFQLSWGTKSVANATESRATDDKSISNFNKQLYRVLAGETNDQIVYEVNLSGAYNMSDNIAFSGGIAWSVATLMLPEMIDNPVVLVTYEEVLKFSEKLYNNYQALSETAIVKTIADPSLDRVAIAAEAKKVNRVFDQRSLMAGTALLLKIMRQFEGIYEKKQFFLVKNGQVGWISAYVNQSVSK
ncbi:MAG: hypothetical protein H7258_10930 [Ferruginibacter sp.]|nr:hypothetical protein [Ferruginibacter sp.]